MTHQFNRKVILLTNLINRIEQNDKTGRFSLKGTITRDEYNAVCESLVCLKNVDLGVLVKKE